ncbi:hypothetical protein TWF696_008450 [Orbilia brochopaga]|uniref:Uncharacterized protein n=1 Tax=Orbilia brochopaga TaxID=3140254 RepID=A0AAV9UGZ8_9PEZI
MYSATARADGRRRELVQAPLPPKYSKPLTAQYLDNFFLSVEPRIGPLVDEEVEITRQIEQEWKSRTGLTPRNGALSDSGPAMALCHPEAVPERLRKIMAFNTFSFIQDGRN